MTFHSPLGLRERAPTPEVRMDMLPLVTVLLIALLLSLAGSRFVFAPGLLVDLGEPDSQAAASDSGATSAKNDAAVRLRLPQTAQERTPGAMTTSTLVVTTRADMAFLDGRRYHINGAGLRQALNAAAQQYGRDAILLLELDKSLTMERQFLLLDYAREAGFRQVLIAAQTAPVRSGAAK